MVRLLTVKIGAEIDTRLQCNARQDFILLKPIFCYVIMARIIWHW